MIACRSIAAMIFLSYNCFLLIGGRDFVLRGGNANRGAHAATVRQESFCRYSIRPVIATISEASISRPRLFPSLPVSTLNGRATDCGDWSDAYSHPGEHRECQLVRHTHDRLLLAGAHCRDRLKLTSSDRVAIPVRLRTCTAWSGVHTRDIGRGCYRPAVRFKRLEVF